MEKLQPGYLVLGRFRVTEEIDGGGQSFIFKGEDDAAPAERNRHVCIKQFEDLVPGSDAAKALRGHYEKFKERLGTKFSDRLRREQRYICLPIDLSEEYGSVIAVFPWLRGMTLEQRLKTEISPRDRARIARAISQSVRTMHAERIVHADLSPHQVMVRSPKNKEGQPVVYAELIDLDAAIVDGETCRGKILGKVGYASPEHFLKDARSVVSYPSDVFTLGLMLLQLLLSVHPYQGYANNRAAYREAISKGYFRLPAGEYDREIVEVLVNCLSPDHKSRPSAKQVHEAMRKLAEEGTISPERHWNGQAGLRRSYVQLERRDASVFFQRIYYEPVILTARELRGSGLPAQLPPVCELRNQGGDWLLKRLHKDVPVSVNDSILRVEGSVRLNPSQIITISSQPFILSLHQYNVAIKALDELLPAKASVDPTTQAKKPELKAAEEGRVKAPIAPARAMPTAQITSAKAETNVISGAQKGVKVTAEYWLRGLRSVKVWVGVWFELSSGASLKDADGLCADGDGNVAVFAELRPENDFQSYTHGIFIPYAQLHLTPGKHELRFYVRILHETGPDMGTEIARSGFYNLAATATISS